MRVAKYIHACVVVEKGNDKLLFDPGKFSFAEGGAKPEQFVGLTGILLTHDHADHADMDALKKIVARNPKAKIWTNGETATKLAEQGISAERFEQGTKTIGGFKVEALTVPHAKMPNSKPPQNTVFRVEGVLLNPGDSFDPAIAQFKGTKLLLLPITAPWLTEEDAAAFAKELAPQQVIPVHDGFLEPLLQEHQFDNWGKHFEGETVVFHKLSKPGAGIEVEG